MNRLFLLFSNLRFIFSNALRSFIPPQVVFEEKTQVDVVCIFPQKCVFFFHARRRGHKFHWKKQFLYTKWSLYTYETGGLKTRTTQLAFFIKKKDRWKRRTNVLLFCFTIIEHYILTCCSFIHPQHSCRRGAMKQNIQRSVRHGHMKWRNG